MARIGQIPKSQLYAQANYSASDSNSVRTVNYEEEATYVDEAAMLDTAEAIREVEAEAAEGKKAANKVDVSKLNKEKLCHLSIDESREIAKQLEVPDRGNITHQDELIAAIQRSL